MLSRGGGLLGLLLILTAHGINASPTATGDGMVYGEVMTNSYETNRGVLRTKQISDEGDSLLIGSEPVEDKGDPETLVTCTRHQDIADYKDHHRTAVSRRAANTYERLPVEGVATAVPYDEYFIFIRKELWSCKTDDKKLEFYRIVNHLLGVTEIRGIQYHDGIEVITRHYLGDKKTAEIKEVKYMMVEPNNKNKYIRYLGKFKEAKRQGEIEVVADAAGTASLVTDKMAKPGQMTHVTELHEEASRIHEIFEKGIDLVVKYNYPTEETTTRKITLGEAASKASCVPEQGIHPFPKQYRLTFYEKISVEGNTYNAEILEEERHKYFIPINQEIWLCQTEEPKKEERKIFFRVVNEVIGRKGVKTLTTHEGVNSIMKLLTKDNEIAIRLKEVRYIDALSYTDIKYLGQIRLKSKEKFERKYNNEKGEMPFVLNDNRVFRLLVSSEGYDLRFGQRWLTEHPNTVQQVVCVRDIEYKYKDSYHTRLNLKASMETDSSKIFSLESPDNYRNHPLVTYLTQEVSICRDSEGEDQFLRVFNELKVVEPVHEVEFYDGVFVSDYVFTGLNFKSVDVIEIKYLSLKDEHVIKYEGKVEVRENEGETPSVLTEDTKAMKVTEEDIVWSVGHFPDVNLNEEDRRKFIRQNSIPYDEEGQFKVKEKGIWRFEFGHSDEYVQKIPKQTGQAVCKPLRELDEIIEINKFRTRPQIVKIEFPTTSPGVTDIIRSQLLELNKGKFFNKTEREFWTCQEDSKDALQFYLVKSKLILHHDGFKGDIKNGWNTITMNKDITVYQLNHKSYARFNFVMMDGKSHFGIFDDIKFFGLKQNTYYNGQYEGELIFTADQQQKKSGTITLVASRDEIASSVVPITRDIEYRVHQDWTYNSVLDESGQVSLQIGNKWKNKIAYSGEVKTCKKREIDEGRFAASFRTKIKNLIQEPGQEKLHNQQLFDKYFEIIKQEVWDCGEGTKLKFLRILNHFHVKEHHCSTIKQVTYYDGVTIMLGKIDSQTCTEIVEIKYLDARSYTLLKYEGKVVLRDKDDKEMAIEGITAKKLQHVAKLENYYLPKDQAYKTFIGQKGVVLEIGVQKDKIINAPYLVCERIANPLPAHLDKYMPVIRVSKSLRRIITTTPVDIDYIHRYFNTTVQLWSCKYKEKTYVRAVTVLRKLEGIELTVAEILNYDGVTIDTFPKLTIKEIKFFEDTEHRIPIRIAGFVHLKEDQRAQEISAERVYYKLDAARLAVTEVNGEGPIMDVGSIPTETFGTRNDHVWCDKITNPTFQSDYKTKVYMSLSGPETQTELDEKKFKDFFDTMEEEEWQCYGNEGFAFKRIVSVHIAIKNIARMFLADGITVGEQIFPDNSRSKKITEIKYLDQHGDTYTTLKYEGKITLQADYNFVEATLFQMPTKYREIAIESSDRAVSARNTKYWPMEVLRAYARKKPATNKDLPPVKYYPQPTRQRFETGGNNLEVGSKHESTLLVEDEDPMRCLLDQWNPINEQRFLTKMKLHFDNKTYELDRDTILEYFDVKLIEVWICVNKDKTMLRVVTKLQGVKKFHFIISHDGIEFKDFKLDNGGVSLNITETKYMDGKTFKILKFTKPLKEIKKVVIPKQSTKPSSARGAARKPGSAGRGQGSSYNKAGSGQGSTGSGQGSAGSGQGSTGSGQGSAGSGQGSSANKAGSAGSGQGSAGSGQGSSANKAGSAGSGQGSTGSGQGSTGSGQGSTGSGQGSTGSGQGSARSGQGSPDNKAASTGSGQGSPDNKAGSGPGSSANKATRAGSGQGSPADKAGSGPGSSANKAGSTGSGQGGSDNKAENTGSEPGDSDYETASDGSGQESSDDEAGNAGSGQGGSDNKATSAASGQGSSDGTALTYSFEPLNPSRKFTAWHHLVSWFKACNSEME